MAKGTFNGRNINIDHFDLELTEELEEAMHALDSDCAHGCGWGSLPGDLPGLRFG